MSLIIHLLIVLLVTLHLTQYKSSISGRDSSVQLSLAIGAVLMIDISLVEIRMTRGVIFHCCSGSYTVCCFRGKIFINTAVRGTTWSHFYISTEGMLGHTAPLLVMLSIGTHAT